jgi:hypothetical protein
VPAHWPTRPAPARPPALAAPARLHPVACSGPPGRAGRARLLAHLPRAGPPARSGRSCRSGRARLPAPARSCPPTPRPPPRPAPARPRCPLPGPGPAAIAGRKKRRADRTGWGPRRPALDGTGGRGAEGSLTGWGTSTTPRGTRCAPPPPGYSTLFNNTPLLSSLNYSGLTTLFNTTIYLQIMRYNLKQFHLILIVILK